MATIFLHAMVKELSGRSEIPCDVDGAAPLGEVLRLNLTERELFLIVDETGAIRKHLNVYYDAMKIRSLDFLIDSDAKIDVFPAVSGG
jgi:molybdopterin converting factor small subunit